MSMTHAAAPVFHVQHFIEIPFTWSADRKDDDAFQSETWDQVEAEAVRLCALHGVSLDATGAISEDGVRLKGDVLSSVHAAATELAAFLSAQAGLVFLQQGEASA